MTRTGWNNGKIENYYPAVGGSTFLVMEKQSGTNNTAEEVFLLLVLPKQELNRNIGVKDRVTPQTEWRDRRSKGPSKAIMTELGHNGGVDVCLPPSNPYFEQSQYQTPP